MAYKGTVKGKCEKFWTKDLTELRQKEGFEPVSKVMFEGDYDAYGVDKKVDLYSDAEVDAAYAEIVEAKKEPSKKDIISFVNDRAKQAGRQKAMLKAVTDAGFIQPTLKEDAGLRFAKIKATLVASFPSLPESVIDTMVAATLAEAEKADAARTTDTTEEVSA